MGLILRELKIEKFRGIGNLEIGKLGKRVAIVGPNSANKSSIINAICFLGSYRMHEYSDIPSCFKPSKIDLREVSIEVEYSFELTRNFKELISDERIMEALLLFYKSELDYLLKTRSDREDPFVKSIEYSLNTLKVAGPLGDVFEDALYHVLRREVETHPSYKPYRPLFTPSGELKMPKDIFEETKYLKVKMELSHYSGPAFEFSLLNEDREVIVPEDIFYFMINNNKVVDSSITFAYILGAVFIKGITGGERNEEIAEYLPPSLLTSEGSNINQFIEYNLSHHPDIFEKISKHFEFIFGKSIKFRKNPLESDAKDSIQVKLGNGEWFSLNKLSDGMYHALRIILQLTTSKEGDILVIDEPELHLHPGAAKRLRKILHRAKNIQIILATHAPIFMDPYFADTVILNRAYSSTPEILSTEKIELALAELGSSGLDALLYDGIIWVEGPSDAIYFERWLELMEPDLKPYIGIVHYGSKSMVPHLDIKAIKSVCRNSVFVIDGDITSKDSDISGRAKELKQKCESNGVYCWVIERRSIENCIPTELIESCVNLPKGTLKITEYDDVIDAIHRARRKLGNSKSSAKMILAQKIAPLITIDHIKGDKYLYDELKNVFNILKSQLGA